MEATTATSQPPVPRGSRYPRMTTSRQVAGVQDDRSSLTRSRSTFVQQSRSSRITAQSSNTRSGPTTRSRKRLITEPPVQAPGSSQRKRARAKQVSLKKPPPVLKAEEDDKKPKAVDNCCICMCDVEPDDLAGISGCDHQFCFGCIEKWAERENSCPLCKNRFNKITRVNGKRRKGMKTTKKVKQRDQRSDLLPGTALEGLLGRLFTESRFAVPGRDVDLTVFSSSANLASRDSNFARLIFPSSSDDDDGAFPNTLFRVLNRRGVMPFVPPLTFTTQTTSRSYATNMNDTTAGNGAENPLEIDDDSDDETVEVVGVRNTL